MIDYNSIILSIIKKHRNFSSAINQHQIAKVINDRIGKDDFIKGRAVRKIIEDLIKDGNPIISSPHSPGGYAWGGSDGEALQCYRQLRRQGIRILLRARRILRNSERGQLKIWNT